MERSELSKMPNQGKEEDDKCTRVLHRIQISVYYFSCVLISAFLLLIFCNRMSIPVIRKIVRNKKYGKELYKLLPYFLISVWTISFNRWKQNFESCTPLSLQYILTNILYTGDTILQWNNSQILKMIWFIYIFINTGLFIFFYEGN